MQLRFLPFAASAVGGRSFLAAIPRPVRASRRRLCYNVASSSSSEKEGEEAEAGGTRDEAEAGRKRDEPGTQEEALRRLAELDAQLEGLSEPKKRPPAPPPSPDPYMDRDMITGRGYTDELPEFSPTYVAFSTLALVILTIFTNVMFNLYIKPSVDGVDQPVRIQRVPLVDPEDRQFK